MSLLSRPRFAVLACTLLIPACTQLPVETDDDETAAPTTRTVCLENCPDSSVTVAPDTPARAESGWRETSWDTLPGWREDDPAATWPAFLETCRALGSKPAWRNICIAAKALSAKPAPEEARDFFERYFTPLQSGADDAEGLVTGYYEPLIRGSRQRSAVTPWPLLAPPDDMLTVDFVVIYPELKSMNLRGRLVANNKVVPYWTRAELEQRRRAGKLPARALLWAADPIDLFFLQVQGSGQVELPDGSRARVGFAEHNGHPYQSIGKWLVKQGELALSQTSMEGIRQWAQRNPQRLDELLNSNPRYVFFRELPQTGDGPIGALGTPLYAGRSIAVDPNHIPLGVPVFLATTWPLSDEPLNRLVMAQDTGGAIKGAARADFFWGFGPEAGAQAGKMRQKGKLWVLLPKETAGQMIGKTPR
jgi:membrane-bound lytic murein transglycosylase A